MQTYTEYDKFQRTEDIKMYFVMFLTATFIFCLVLLSFLYSQKTDADCEKYAQELHQQKIIEQLPTRILR